MNGSESLFSLTPTPRTSSMESLSNQADISSQESESDTQKLMSSFQEVLRNKIQQVDQLHRTAQTKMQKFAAGEIDNVHDVSISMQKARMGIKLMNLVRKKILSGFDDLKQLR
ncbi:MAG: flagellar hook-basal body complex protein FliE [bacterium]